MRLYRLLHPAALAHQLEAALRRRDQEHLVAPAFLPAARLSIISVRVNARRVLEETYLLNE